MLGVVRKQEEKTVGKVTGITYGNGTIPAGAWVAVNGTELRYKVMAETTFGADAPFLLPVIAEHSGSGYNVSPGTPIRLTRTINGLNRLILSEDWIETAGQEVEADETYRQRIKDRWKSQTLGDTKEVYRYYATSVPGVAAVEVVRTPRGPGSTDIIVAAVNGIPGQNLLDAVEQALNDHELLGFDVQVKAPTAVLVAVQIECRGEAEEADMRLIAERYVYGLGIGGRFSVRDLYARYSNLPLPTLEILSPVRDVQTDTQSMITATINITKVAV
jgi:uncharacterized phage protein gp47/JayE